MPTKSRKPTRSSVPEQFRTGTRRTAPPQAPAAAAQEIVPFETPGFITKRQWEFVCDLLGKKDLLKSPGFFDKVNAMDAEEYAAHIEWLKDRMKYTTRPKASETIDALKALPYKARTDSDGGKDDRTVPQVPEGRYALRHPEDELNPIRFYKVKHGEDKTERGGKNWKGAIFVERFASDDTFPVKFRSAEYFRVLKEVAENPLAAAQLYGDEFERCCICNRGLTRRISRKMRIGPVCLRKHGDVFGLDPEAYIEENRAELIAAGLDPDETLDQPRERRHIIDHT